MSGAVAFMSLSFGEIAVLGVVSLLVFGGRLPEVMRNVGRAYGRLRQGMDDLANPLRQEMHKLDDRQAALSRRPAPSGPKDDLPPLATEPPAGVYPTAPSPRSDPNPDPDGDPDSIPEDVPEDVQGAPVDGLGPDAGVPAELLIAPEPDALTEEPKRSRPPTSTTDRGTAADEPPPV